MRYRYRSLLAADRVIGAFTELGGGVAVVLFADYFREIPHQRNWRRPVSLDMATTDDMENEVIAAHPSLAVADAAWTDDLVPDPASVRGATGETARRMAEYRAVRDWLRART